MIEYLCLLRNDIAFHTFIFLTNTFLISFNAYQIWLLNHSFVYRIFFNSIRFNLFTFTKKLPWVWVQRTIAFNWQISSHPNILILIKWWDLKRNVYLPLCRMLNNSVTQPRTDSRLLRVSASFSYSRGFNVKIYLLCSRLWEYINR